MHTIEVSDEVWKEIADRGKFGETEDDVLHRVFEIPHLPLCQKCYLCWDPQKGEGSHRLGGRMPLDL